MFFTFLSMKYLVDTNCINYYSTPWFSTSVSRITVVCVAKILYYLYINILHIISFDIINMILFQHYDEIVKPRDKKNNYEDILTS